MASWRRGNSFFRDLSREGGLVPPHSVLWRAVEVIWVAPKNPAKPTGTWSLMQVVPQFLACRPRFAFVDADLRIARWQN